MSAADIRSVFPVFFAIICATSLTAPAYFSYLLPLATLLAIILSVRGNASVAEPSTLLSATTSPYVQLALVTSLALLMSGIYSIQPEHSFTQAIEAAFALVCFAMLWSLPLAKNFKLEQQQQTWLFWLYMLLLAGLITSPLLNKTGLIESAPQLSKQQAVIIAISCWPFSLYLTSNSKFFRPLLTYSLTALALCLSGYEISWLIFLLSAITYLFFKFLRLKPLPATLCLGLAMLTISLLPMGLALSGLNPASPPFSMAIPGFSGQDLSGNVSLWQASLELFRQYMPFGAGIDTSRYILPPAEISATASQQLHPQNYIIELGLELGLLGLILAALAIIAASLLFYHTPAPVRPYIAASLMAAATLYSLSFSVWDEWRSAFIALIMLLLFRFSRNRERRKQTRNLERRSAISGHGTGI